MDFILYESGTTRSARCRWTLLEAGINFKSISEPKLIGSDELREMHPLAKLPVAVINGAPLFESAAICTFIADQFPDTGLIANPGTFAQDRTWSYVVAPGAFLSILELFFISTFV